MIGLSDVSEYEGGEAECVVECMWWWGSSNTNLNTLTDALVVTGEGKVGIGVGSPTQDLEVANNVVINGELTVLGGTTTVSTTNTVIGDKLIELGNGTVGAPTGDAGIVIDDWYRTKSIISS